MSTWGTVDNQIKNSLLSTSQYLKNITPNSSFPNGVCHNIMKLSLRLFWTKDVCRKPLYVVDNLTGGCFLLPFNLECIQKKKKKRSFGFASAYWKSDIAHGYKILPVSGCYLGRQCWHCSFKPDVTSYQMSNIFFFFFCLICAYKLMLLQFCWWKILFLKYPHISFRSHQNPAQNTDVLYIN